MGSSDRSVSVPGRSPLRRATAAIFVVVAVLVSAACPGPPGITARAVAAEQDSDAGHLLATINERMATLGVARHSGELVFEKALRVRNAIKDRDFTTARNIVAEVLANSRIQNWRFYPFEPFVRTISDTKDFRFEERLNEWDLEKQDPIATLLRAQYYIDLAWLKRGENFAQETQGDKLSAFVAYSSRALAEIDIALKLDKDNPYAYWLKLRIMHGFGNSKDVLFLFEGAIARYSNYYPLYDIVLSTLEPRWGGTIDAMHAFVDRYAGPAPEHSPLKLLYVSLYRSLLSSAWVNCNIKGRKQEQLTECGASLMGQWATPHLEQQVRTALTLYDNTDAYEFGIAIERLLGDMLATTGAEAFSGAVLEWAAAAMHSSTQLEPAGTDRNNYIIDKMVGDSWSRKGFYDNALKKYQQAAEDVARASFPGEEEKDLGVGAIYDRLARVHANRHEHIETIIYEKSALKLGVRSGQEHLPCYGYYQLKLYSEAVDACTEAIKDADNLLARFWRGMTYRELGKLQAALPDFESVADSNNGFRTSAALNMSVIYDRLKDYRHSLEILNRYSFLYDEKTQNKNNIAAAYNNRCFAYMELGELKKALTECDASLKYGSLPEAIRKQQELTKRLNGPTKEP